MAERDALLQLGAAALARGGFREAHEHWEAAWQRSEGGDRPVVQALAQLAAALVLVADGRSRGAASVLARAHRRLSQPGASTSVGGIDAAAVRAAVERLQGELAAGRVPDLAISLG